MFVVLLHHPSIYIKSNFENVMIIKMNKFILLFCALLIHLIAAEDSPALNVFTFGNIKNHFVQRLVLNAEENNYTVKVIDQESTISKSNEIQLMKNQLSHLNKDGLVVFMESASLLLAPSESLIEAFNKIKGEIVFSGAFKCRPDESLSKSFPEVDSTEKQFIGKYGVMAKVETLLNALSVENLQTIDDVQYYFSKLYLDNEQKDKLKLKIDTKSEIFQNMDGAIDEVSLEYTDKGVGYLTNILTNSKPVIVQAASNKINLNTLSNYLGNNYDKKNGCKQCLKLEANTANKNAEVSMSIFVDKPTPFINEFFDKISKLNYPKQNIVLRISNSVEAHSKDVDKFIDENTHLYKSFSYSPSTDNLTAVQRRIESVKLFQSSGISYYLSLDSIVHLTNTETIQHLLKFKKSVVSPTLSRRGELWSNFWGDLSDMGYYRRSFDYLDIVNSEKMGLWNVPYINNMYLMTSEVANVDMFKKHELYTEEEYDMNFCGNLRDGEVFMYVANDEQYGYLTNNEDTLTNHLHNDLWEIFANPLDWKEKYIHKDYDKVVQENVTLQDLEQPCPDVFWWPLVSEKFARDLVEEMEYFGEWSNGSNKDPRLEGGYENVPTRDIHMRQVGWEEHWQQVLRTYVYPMQIKIFKGYYDEPSARMNFVVRYKPSEQDRLRPHQDASSYTLNIALNHPHIDYEGGGAKYNRYNCSITESRVGWTIMSPGRVTHQHEGLPTTKGTRYIFVTFVNP